MAYLCVGIFSASYGAGYLSVRGVGSHTNDSCEVRFEVTSYPQLVPPTVQLVHDTACTEGDGHPFDITEMYPTPPIPAGTTMVVTDAVGPVNVAIDTSGGTMFMSRPMDAASETKLKGELKKRWAKIPK